MCKSRFNSVNLINLDNPYDKYLIPIYPILFNYNYKYKYKFKFKLINLINLDNPNHKYLIPISLIFYSNNLISKFNLNIYISVLNSFKLSNYI